jgi:uncharacterized membrane protein YfcA
MFADVMTGLSGIFVGTILGLVGGGGSILAVPLLVYAVGVPSAHVAIGTGAIAVAMSALANLGLHARSGNVKWRCATVFSAAGIAGALTGAHFAKMVDGQRLLLLFGLLMLVVGIAMLKPRKEIGVSSVRLDADNALQLLPRLVGVGLAVGLMSGFFGIGGGFLIVPGLMLATKMPLKNAIGTSLVSVAAFGASTAASYAVSGLIDWRIATLFVAGGLLGGAAGVALGKNLAGRKYVLNYIFAGVVIAAGLYVSIRGFMQL